MLLYRSNALSGVVPRTGRARLVEVAFRVHGIFHRRRRYSRLVFKLLLFRPLSFALILPLRFRLLRPAVAVVSSVPLRRRLRFRNRLHPLRRRFRHALDRGFHLFHHRVVHLGRFRDRRSRSVASFPAFAAAAGFRAQAHLLKIARRRALRALRRRRALGRFRLARRLAGRRVRVDRRRVHGGFGAQTTHREGSSGTRSNGRRARESSRCALERARARRTRVLRRD
mmetsp:Transcript_2763/g.10645  ORF Transcript_2763/g.10645 Transcript_2763/m.10645 type:complete len:226 (+) Transcript_2763:749-1426(+)